MTVPKRRQEVLGVAPRGFAHEIFLEGKAAIPPSNNVIKHMHWAKYRKIREAFGWALQMALIETGYPCLPRQAPKMRVQITVHSHGARKRRLDSDNLWGGCKPLIDAMKDVYLIRNDSHVWLDLGVCENREPGRTGTRIQFEPIRTDGEGKVAMPIKPEKKNLYPPNWDDIAFMVKAASGFACKLCQAENGKPHPRTCSKVVITVHHINGDPTDNRRVNLIPLCQRCHNILDQPYRHPRDVAGEKAQAMLNTVRKEWRQVRGRR